MQDLFYIHHNEQQEGPYTYDQVRQLLDEGTIAPFSLAWKEGMEEWAPLSSIFPSPKENEQRAVPPPLPTTRVTPPSPTPIEYRSINGPSGVGGWLTFFCVTQVVIGPLFTLGNISMTWTEAQEVFALYPSFRIAVMWESAGVIAISVCGFITGFIIWVGNPSGRDVAKIYLVIRLIGFVCVEIITVALMQDLPTDVVSIVIDSIFWSIMRETIFFLIWWFYFRNSIRVRNTYGAT